MDYSNRTGYLKYKTKIDNIETDFEIFETNTHVFIFIDQIEGEINLYDNEVKKELLKKNLQRKKEFNICSNLRSKDTVHNIVEHIYEILTQ